MKSLNTFVNEINEGIINEYRTKKSDKEEAPELKDVKGQDEEENGSGGVWAVEPPTEDDIVNGIDKNTLTRNKKRILMRLKSKKPFFIQGEAGWGKTSIITQLAHQCKRTVITVYLDKAEATDLGGLPVAKKSKKGADYVSTLMPAWAKVMYDNPETQFLLFFDEMNQAAPDVMNALMPIVLKNEVCGHKFENFIVGAAGNFESENGAVNELSGPLLSRFGGIITWESGDWDAAFAHLHKKWDDKLSKELLDTFKDHASIFKNPRDVESFMIESIFNLREDGDYDIFDADDWKEQIQGLVKDDLSRTQEKEIDELAEACYDFMNSAEKKDENTAGRSGNKKDSDMLTQQIKDGIKFGIENGFIAQEENGKVVRYGISEENIVKTFCELGDLNAEMVERYLRKLETDNIKYKFTKDEQWKKEGYKDPFED